MAAHRDSILELFGEDDLIEVHVNSSRNPASFANLFLPNPRSTSSSAQPRPVHHHQSRRSERRPQPQGQQPQQPAPVIDLTAEPDSPIQTRGSLPQSRSGRNPRRTNSQRISPPQLSRSDGTFFGRTASIIDLTVDSPEDERPSNPPAGEICDRAHDPTS
ncbi:hypothetical protein MRS44_008956 [Fusarium solani]|uniref:uncharacterized protein n=1 Tax=Fusarium solani TaxID=169388 RepID=UPI0032C46011|nr:hypothetical protein MRS44_008956 [Fusarium solani]